MPASPRHTNKRDIFSCRKKSEKIYSTGEMRWGGQKRGKREWIFSSFDCCCSRSNRRFSFICVGNCTQCRISLSRLPHGAVVVPAKWNNSHSLNGAAMWNSSMLIFFTLRSRALSKITVVLLSLQSIVKTQPFTRRLYGQSGGGSDCSCLFGERQEVWSFQAIKVSTDERQKKTFIKIHEYNVSQCEINRSFRTFQFSFFFVHPSLAISDYDFWFLPMILMRLLSGSMEKRKKSFGIIKMYLGSLAKTIKTIISQSQPMCACC